MRERRRGIIPHESITIRKLFCYGLYASALYQVLFLFGVANTTSGNTALIIATVPMWTALLACIFISEILRRLAWVGLSLALIGTIVVAFQKGDVSLGNQHLWGNMIVLGAAFVWSSGTVYSKPMLQKISPIQLSAAATGISLPVHWILAAPHFSKALPALNSVGLWLIILYSGVLSSGLSLPMWNFGVRHAGAAHASAIQNLIPVIAIVAAWFIRGESATIAHLVGGTLILGGLLLMRLSRKSFNSK